MSGRDDESGAKPGSFAELLGDDGVRPLDRAPDKTGPEAKSKRARANPAAARFHFPDPDDPMLGFAAGIQSSQLRRLRDGRIPATATIDLHGLFAAEARRELLAELGRAAAAGARCVLVVHGKGLRSSGPAVLRDSLAGWLADPQLDGRVLAFAPAAPADGGRGASYVLLRRRR